MTRHESSSSTRGPKWLVELIKNLRLAWRLLRDPLVPAWVKWVPLAALAYIVLPTDFIPDFVLGFGQVDDLTVLLLGLKLLFDLSPSEIVERHLAEMSSIEASYRVVTEEQAQATDVTGYLDVESRVLSDELLSSGAEPQDRSSDEAP